MEYKSKKESKLFDKIKDKQQVEEKPSQETLRSSQNSETKNNNCTGLNEVDLTEVLATPMWLSLNEKEKTMIQEFKVQVKDFILPHHTDYYFSCFLIARKWDMKLSVELFINAMKHRQEEKIDDILETFPQTFWYNTLADYWPTSVNAVKFHYAKDGGPVVYERIGILFFNQKLHFIILFYHQKSF